MRPGNLWIVVRSSGPVFDFTELPSQDDLWFCKVRESYWPILKIPQPSSIKKVASCDEHLQHLLGDFVDFIWQLLFFLLIIASISKRLDFHCPLVDVRWWLVDVFFSPRLAWRPFWRAKVLTLWISATRKIILVTWNLQARRYNITNTIYTYLYVYKWYVNKTLYM